MAEGLKARGIVFQRSTGYPSEEYSNDFNVPADIELIGSRTVTYSYRDSNTSDLGDNNNSTRVQATFKFEWNITQGSNNSFDIDVKCYLAGIVRNDKRGYVSANPGRRIWVYDGKGNLKWGPKDSNPATTGTIYSGNLFVSEIKYTLKPETSSDASQMSVEYVNWTVTKGSPEDVNSPFVDHLMLGIQFVNEKPKECDPPVLMGVTQTDDICENTVEACLKFAPCSCEGMGLVLQYHFDGEDWGAAEAKGQTRQIDASNSSPNVICLQDLPPTNHTWAPVHLYWRAKYIPITSEMPETPWVSGSFEIIFILAPHETVPDISSEECAMLKRGDLIDKYQQEVCYNEFSCADMAVQNPSRDKDVEECKKINGVS